MGDNNLGLSLQVHHGSTWGQHTGMFAQYPHLLRRSVGANSYDRDTALGIQPQLLAQRHDTNFRHFGSMSQKVKLAK